ncbi:MAG: hypothetical protein KAU28_09355 [Phycisphaerae bacterium]|nr:hypothetical protein [Phycisphaerae bacterium]
MGNKLGWILAGALAIAGGLLFLFVVVIPRPSRPTAATQKKGFMELKDVGVGPGEVVSLQPSAPGNAGDDYFKALTLYKENKKLLEEVLENFDKVQEGRYPFHFQLLQVLMNIDEHVAAGAAREEMAYTFVHTPKHFVIGYRYGPAGDLRNVSDCLSVLAAHYISHKDFARAAKVFEHQFILGWHMMRERSRAAMVECGIAAQENALSYLQWIYSQPGQERKERLGAIGRYGSELRNVRKAYEKKFSIVWNRKQPPGDVFNIAENDKDRAWRVDAILRLGWMRFSVTRRNDIKYINKLINEYCSSSDPLEAAAAKAARDMTREDLN